MGECWICGRATVFESDWLPLNICKRARCEPEREYLADRHAQESLCKQYSEIAAYGDYQGGEA